MALKTKFAVPLIKKETDAYNAFKPPPLLGMRQGRVFVARPLHDPSGEFAIVLYDPTVDDKPVQKEVAVEKLSQEDVKTLDTPLVHKSLADILGLKKKVDDRPRVPVVIDPRLTKVLRPHQVEGVKFLYRATTGLIDEKANGCIMADEMGLGKTVSRDCFATEEMIPYSSNRLTLEGQPYKSASSLAHLVWFGIGRTSLSSGLVKTLSTLLLSMARRPRKSLPSRYGSGPLQAGAPLSDLFSLFRTKHYVSTVASLHRHRLACFFATKDIG
jgi:hypothetical protein